MNAQALAIPGYGDDIARGYDAKSEFDKGHREAHRGARQQGVGHRVAHQAHAPEHQQRAHWRAAQAQRQRGHQRAAHEAEFGEGLDEPVVRTHGRACPASPSTRRL